MMLLEKGLKKRLNVQGVIYLRVGRCIVCDGTGKLLYPPKPHEMAGKFICSNCDGKGRMTLRT